jgi:hypothetical protein
MHHGDELPPVNVNVWLRSIARGCERAAAGAADPAGARTLGAVRRARGARRGDVRGQAVVRMAVSHGSGRVGQRPAPAGPTREVVEMKGKQ